MSYTKNPTEPFNAGAKKGRNPPLDGYQVGQRFDPNAAVGNSFANFIKLILTMIRFSEEFDTMKWVYFGPSENAATQKFSESSEEAAKFVTKAQAITTNTNLSNTEAHEQFVALAKESIPRITKDYLDGNKALIDLIQKVESSGGNYNIANGGGIIQSPDGRVATQMTINEVLEWQDDPNNRLSIDNSRAAGAHQIVRRTLGGKKGEGGGLRDQLDIGDELFDENMQDLLAVVLIEGRVDRARRNNTDLKTELRNEWIALRKVSDAELQAAINTIDTSKIDEMLAAIKENGADLSNKHANNEVPSAEHDPTATMSNG